MILAPVLTRLKNRRLGDCYKPRRLRAAENTTIRPIRIISWAPSRGSLQTPAPKPLVSSWLVCGSVAEGLCSRHRGGGQLANHFFVMRATISSPDAMHMHEAQCEWAGPLCVLGRKNGGGGVGKGNSSPADSRHWWKVLRLGVIYSTHLPTFVV